MTTPDVAYGAALQRAAVVMNLIQGEVLGIADACVVVGEAAAPMSPEVELAAADHGITEGLIVAPYVVDNVVLLTQTCDLQETTPEEHVCLVAPVRQVPTELAREALRGRRPRYAGLPWLNDETIADLSLITTIERSLLVDAPRRARPRTPRERLHFANSVSRYLTRPALPDHINVVLKPLLQRISQRYDKNSPEGRCLSKVAEFRLEAAPHLDAPAPALTVLTLIEESDLPTLPPYAELDNARIDSIKNQGIPAAAEQALDEQNPIRKREAWTALCELWIQRAGEQALTTANVGSVDMVVLNGEELSYARSLNAPPLDLRYLSTRSA